MNNTRRSNRPPPTLLTETGEWSSNGGGPPKVTAAWLSQPRIGETVNGDAVIVRALDERSVLVAVVDALGHGPKAWEVAQRCVTYLRAAPPVIGVLSLIHGVHEALQGSRGAAMLALLVSSRGLEVCSVGNVDLRSSNTKIPFVLTPGVLGVRLRAPKLCSIPGPIVDRFVLYSDGVSGRFDLKGFRSQGTNELAKQIFTSHRHAHDDGSVVVVDIG